MIGKKEREREREKLRDRGGSYVRDRGWENREPGRVVM